MAYDPEYHRKWRADHKDEIAKYQRMYRDSNRQVLNKGKQEHYAANRQTYREHMKAWRTANLEKDKKAKREYYQANKLAALEQTRAWRAANPGKFSAYRRNWKARAKGAEGFHTAEDVKAIWDRQGMKCAVPGCTHPISSSPDKHKYHVDHIKPFARGGSNWPSNLQILCGFHNMQKHNQDEHEWAASHGLSLQEKQDQMNEKEDL